MRVAYEPRGQAEPSELVSHELGLFEAAGLRAFRVRRGEAAWERAEPTGPFGADPLRALGFDVSDPPSLLYAPGAFFETELPARRVRTRGERLREPVGTARRCRRERPRLGDRQKLGGLVGASLPVRAWSHASTLSCCSVVVASTLTRTE